MSNKGQKALAAQVSALRSKIKNLEGMNHRLNVEVRKLQSVQLQMIQPNFFIALYEWFRRWKNYRK
jgi:regulator of replication initiation timing